MNRKIIADVSSLPDAAFGPRTLIVFAFTHDLKTSHFSDVADNCMYWHFVALAWLPIYALVYWVPRLLQ